jgi:hypothetical protein
MCPNCLSNLTMIPSLLLGAGLGGAGSAVLLAAAGLRLRTARAPESTQSNTEEILS